MSRGTGAHPRMPPLHALGDPGFRGGPFHRSASFPIDSLAHVFQDAVIGGELPGLIYRISDIVTTTSTANEVRSDYGASDEA